MPDLRRRDRRLEAAVARLQRLGYGAHFIVTLDGLVSCSVCGLETAPPTVTTTPSVRTPDHVVLALVCDCCRNRGVACVPQPA
jgi:hypothetical protein